MHILFCRTNQKDVLQKEIDWVLLIDWEPCPWFPLTELLKMICARSYAWFLNFFVKGRGLGLFFCSLMSSPNSVKYLWPVQMSKNKWVGSISNYPKSEIWPSFELLKPSKMISLIINISPVMEKLEKSNLNLIQRSLWVFCFRS